MVPPLLRLLPLALLLAPALAAGASGAWRARLGMESGVDTNAARDYQQNLEQRPAPLLSALGTVEGQLQGAHGWAAGAYDVGARKFLGPAWTEDTLVQATQLEGALALGPLLQLGLEGRAKDRRGGRRAYTDLAASGVLTLLPGPQVELRLRLGAHRFLYREYFGASFGAVESGLQLRYRLDRHQSLSAGGELGERRYNDVVRLDLKPTVDPTRRRQDGVLGVSVGYHYRGPFAASITYSHLAQHSNSFAETVLRHRVSLTSGVRLPWELTALGQAVLQWALYPDGAYFSSESVLAEDDESLSSLSLKLARPLHQRLDLEVRYALYGGAIPEHRLRYLRQVATVGFSWRL